jgi:hypothetical protein
MNKIKHVMLALGLLVMAGCATDAPHAKIIQEIAQASHIHANDDSNVSVEPSTGVVMLKYEKERMAETIEARLESKKALNPVVADKRQYEIDVLITRYEKGSAFARTMLAGLGQIHIEGNIKVYLMPAKEMIGEFGLSKTFAWGGVYGGTTTIEDAEQGFAEGIADSLTGQTDGNASKNAR